MLICSKRLQDTLEIQRLLSRCVTGRRDSSASNTQYITLDEEFTIPNCFPLHAQKEIKNNKCHPSVSLPVFLYQSLLHWYIHHSVIHPSSSPPSILHVPPLVYLSNIGPVNSSACFLLSTSAVNHVCFISETRVCLEDLVPPRHSGNL